MRYLSNLNLNKNELQNARVHNLDTNSIDIMVNPVVGQIVFDTTSSAFKIYDGNIWKVVGKEYTGGTNITIDGTTINHDTFNTTSTTNSLTAIHGSTLDVIDSVTVSNGHVTGYNTRTITLPDEYVHPDYSLNQQAGADTTLTSITLIDGLTTNSTGHLTGATWRKLVGGSNVTIAPTADGNITINSSFTNDIDYISDVSFNIADGNLSISGVGNAFNGTISLDGRYLQEEVDTLNTVTSRGNSTENAVTIGELRVSNTGTGTGNLIIDGDLTVSGTTTTVNTETIALADNIVELNSNLDSASAPTQNAGLEINRGLSTNYQFVFDETNDDFRVGEIGDLQPVLTRDEEVNLSEGDLLIWDSVNNRAVGKTASEISVVKKHSETIGDGVSTSYQITHNFATQDVTVTLRDSVTNEIVYTDVTNTANNYVTVDFAVAPATDSYRVVVTG